MTEDHATPTPPPLIGPVAGTTKIRVPRPDGERGSLEYEVSGDAYHAGHVRLSIDGDFGAAVPGIAATLKHLLERAHPALLPRLGEIVVPKRGHPDGSDTPASGGPRPPLVIFWLSPLYRLWLKLPTLEHELAHVQFEDSGPPNAVEWEAAMAADESAGLADGWLVCDAIAGEYPRNEHVIEDWAYSVEKMLYEDRAPPPPVPGDMPPWRAMFPHRAATIDRVLVSLAAP